MRWGVYQTSVKPWTRVPWSTALATSSVALQLIHSASHDTGCTSAQRKLSRGGAPALSPSTSEPDSEKNTCLTEVIASPSRPPSRPFRH